MTTLNIDMTGLYDVFQEIRNDISRLDDAGRAFWISEGSIYKNYRDLVQANRDMFLSDDAPTPADAATVDELAGDLSVAARRAMQSGATSSQIEYLATLAWEAGDRSYGKIMGGCGQLSKREASNLIDLYKVKA